MKAKKITRKKQNNFLYPELMDQLNPNDPLLMLGEKSPALVNNNTHLRHKTKMGVCIQGLDVQAKTTSLSPGT